MGVNNNGSTSVREFYANGIRMSTSEVEAKLDQGNIEEAESALKEGLSITSEVSFSMIFCY